MCALTEHQCLLEDEDEAGDVSIQEVFGGADEVWWWRERQGWRC